MHKGGEDSLTLALTPFTIVTNSKSPIHVYIHIFIKTVTKNQDSEGYFIFHGFLWGSMDPYFVQFLPLRRTISQMTVHFAPKLILFYKLKFKPLIIYDHALIWWLFLDLRTGEILTFRSLKMNKFLKAFNANLKRVRRESFIKIKSG